MFFFTLTSLRLIKKCIVYAVKIIHIARERGRERGQRERERERKREREREKKREGFTCFARERQ